MSAALLKRLSFLSVDVQTGQEQPITGIPCDVPLPSIVRTPFNASLSLRDYKGTILLLATFLK